MVSEHGWDYNTKSGPPQIWDHGKDAQSYYYVTGWLDLIKQSDTAIGNSELEDSAKNLSMPDSNAASSNTAGPQTEEHHSTALKPDIEAPKAVTNSFLIMGHEDKVNDTKRVNSAGDGWMAEATLPGIIEDGRVWRGVKTFRVPIIREIQISEEPNISPESGAQSNAAMGKPRGGNRGRYRGSGYRGRGGAGGVSAERWAATRGW